MIEYPLRALVLVAQVHAQMWKRNGYAILHQVTYYQEIRFVSEMFDRDIQMLQVLLLKFWIKKLIAWNFGFVSNIMKIFT